MQVARFQEFVSRTRVARTFTKGARSPAHRDCASHFDYTNLLGTPDPTHEKHKSFCASSLVTKSPLDKPFHAAHSFFTRARALSPKGGQVVALAPGRNRTSAKAFRNGGF